MNEESINEDYVTTPQNDREQINQIAREYEGEPAKGLAHGLQKDAIQNGIGARISENEIDSYKNWSFHFKLFKIGDKYALSFWDAGTTGLTGSILSVGEISRWSAESKLKANQRLSRFLTRFDSGGNSGPGSFGRGKLIFHAASNDSAILCDTLRYDDKKYLAFERKLRGHALTQSQMPFEGKEALELIVRVTQEALEPLKVPGTRITILDLREEITNAIKNSFDEDHPEVMNDFSQSFAKMIEETWWEILDKFNAKIYIEFDGKTKQVTLGEPLKSIACMDDKKNGWKVYRKTHVPVVVQDTTYYIKEIKLILSPTPLDENIRSIWVQRKKMKIGDVKGAMPHHTIFKQVAGYVLLEKELEDEIEKSENPTHYSFNFHHRAPNQIKQTINNHLQQFQEALGIRTVSDEKQAQQDMQEIMKEINPLAQKLGLVTGLFQGPEQDKVELIIKSFKLPQINSKRVDFEDKIGPIIYKIKNNTNRKFFLALEQKKKKDLVQEVHNQTITLEAHSYEEIECKAFKIENDEFESPSSIKIIAKVNQKDSGEKLCQASRTLWLGMEEPPTTKELFTLVAYKPLFPRGKSTRVELNEAINNMRFKISNKTPVDVKINFDLLAKKSSDQTIIKEIRSEKDILLQAMSDFEIGVGALQIVGEKFKAVNDSPANPQERKCEIYFSARLAENVPQLNKIKSEYLGKKKIEFFVGIDPEGESIFKETLFEPDPLDGKRARYTGDRATGFTLRINSDHPSYNFAIIQTTEVKKEYFKEQMLQQAYALAVAEGEFSGLSEEFQQILISEDLAPADAFLKIQELVGKAYIEMGE